MDQKLYNFLHRLLGETDDPDTTWVYYQCPFCAKKGKIKKKFAINIQTFQWKCWVCNERGNNLYSLIRKLGKWHLNTVLINLLPTIQTKAVQYQQQDPHLSLPKQFIPLNTNKQFLLKNKALNYLKKRNLTDYQINKYNIGVCQSGRYQNRIIIPSYNQNNKLNYYTGRSMDPNNQIKYLNPKAKKDSIIVFQNMINWNYPIIITQGMFDAITVNFNAIPLMGKTLSQKLMKNLLKYDAQVLVSLDNDVQQDQNKIVKKLNDIGLYEVSYLNLNIKDPSQMGRKQYWDYLFKNKKKFTTQTSLQILKKKVGKIFR